MEALLVRRLAALPPRALRPQAWRGALVRTMVTRPRPSYRYVTKLLSDPVIETLGVVSRIARILIGSTLIVGGVTFATWEGTHQYVENVLMRRDAPGSATASPDESASVARWGWDTDERLEALGHCYGTDPRLGIFGRHMVRSAWMAEHWGSGIAPSLAFGHNPRAITEAEQDAATAHAGLRLAENFLSTGIRIAEERHMVVPDLPQEAPLDATAVALELWLSAVREQIGTPLSLARAELTCEKLYDVCTNDAALRTALATRIGTLFARMDRFDDGRAWIDRALGGRSSSGLVSALLARRIPAMSPRDVRAASAALQALSVMHVRAATKGTARRTHLEQALRTQLAALRLLAAAGADALASQDGSADALQVLWTQQREGIFGVHVAETLYALERETPTLWQRASALVHRDRILQARPSDYVMAPYESATGAHAASREWLAFACDRAANVAAQLASADAPDTPALVWRSTLPSVAHASKQLLLDAHRLRNDAEHLLDVLRQRAL